jgi:hypothetical protein
MQKPFESGGGDCRSRTPSALPLLQGLEFGGYACGNESGNGFGLAQVFGLSPRFELKNDRSWSLLRQGCFLVFQKESFECRRGHDLGRRTRSFPLLNGAKLYWQAPATSARIV